MKIDKQEKSVEELLEELKPRENLMKDRGNGIYLSDKQVECLKNYHFHYEQYQNLEELIFQIEDYLSQTPELEQEELESIADSLMEFHYYHETKK